MASTATVLSMLKLMPMTMTNLMPMMKPMPRAMASATATQEISTVLIAVTKMLGGVTDHHHHHHPLAPGEGDSEEQMVQLD
jgi:hypothetical protein